jgi:hypothetical protein
VISETKQALRFFSAYGRIISSDLPLANLTEVAGGPACITVCAEQATLLETEGSLVHRLEHRQLGTIYEFHRCGGGYFWRYPQAGELSISRDGCHIGWNAQPGHEADIAALIAGPALGLGLQLQGQTCLHGSAAIVDGRAVAILAPSGFGKSTTAATLVRRGCELLTDDVIALQPQVDRPWVQPGPARMKLWPEALAHTQAEELGLQQHLSWLEKRIVPAESLGRVCSEPMPLGALFSLAPVLPDRPARPIRQTGMQAVLGLVANSYNAQLLAFEPQILAAQFEILSSIADTTPVFELEVPRDLSRLDETLDLMLEAYRAARTI